MGSFYRYYRYLKEGGREQEEELLRLLDVLTINETAFFRNRPQFEFLEEVVLPGLAEQKKKQGDFLFRIWSAGCATGEEPYSIAISALESLMPRSAWEVRVYASDLSLSALERADRGLYPEVKLTGLSGERERGYFAKTNDGYLIRDEVKRLVIYDFHNLKHENGLRNLDVVFCRNVLIYFDPDEQQRVVTKLVRALKPGGYLFLGHSESVQGKIDDLKFVHHRRGTAYRKVAP
jgi:chemotaxis protein methyltransferase CheR